MALPLLLAGPILRRVESTSAAVWVALREQADVQLVVWEGQLSANVIEDPFVSSPSIRPRRIGENLHLALLRAHIPPESGKAFQSDRTYCYDLRITLGTTTHSLKSLGLLEDETEDGLAKTVKLGYEPNLLPSFAPPPTELTNLRVLYGSCRRPAHPDPDALVWVDDFLLAERRYQDPRVRPHQLFLGGDQIYADDVNRLHMLMVMELGKGLIGTTESGGSQLPRERIEVGRLLHLKSGVTKLPEVPREAYEPTTDAEAKAKPLPDDPTLPADRAHFPEEHRKDLTQRAAQFTSTDGDNHLISVGEFAAMYLSVWSNACWTAEIPHVRLVPPSGDVAASRPLTWTTTVTPDERIQLPDLEPAAQVPLHLYRERERVDEELTGRKSQASLRRSLSIHREFLGGLSRVRRALANIPTYMIFDDHDVTDDYFLNPVWRERVLGTPLGRTILRNAMLTYALFQDWGNDPARYESGPHAELLRRATELFPPDTTGPAKAPATRLDELFGHDLHHKTNTAGQYDPVRPPLHWHFSVDGPKHRVIVLDNRTRRSYVTDLGPPGNVSAEALADQIPQPPLPAGVEVLMVVTPLQVIGPPVLDSLLAPMIYRLMDLKGIGSDSDLNPASPTGMRQMTGTDPDAIEAWAMDADTFEHLLKRLAPYRRVVLLSGDVHNSSGTAMSYWRQGESQPSRIVQFTSSGLKNVMPPKITAVDRSAGFAQQMIRAGIGTERIGWDRAADNLVLLPDGRTALDLVAATRKRLRTEPVMIPTWGWPDDQDDNPEIPDDPVRSSRLNPAHPPSWRWRMTPLLDVRPDMERPEPIRPDELDHDEVDRLLADSDTAVEAYRRIAARHQSALRRLRNARQILFRSNFGLVRFEQKPADVLIAVHEVHTAFTDPNAPTVVTPPPEAYLVQRASLGPVDEDPPTRLRAKVFEVPQMTGSG